MKQSEYIAFLIAIVLSFLFHLAMDATLVDAAYIPTRSAPGHKFNSSFIEHDSDFGVDTDARDVGTPENELEQAQLAVVHSLEARRALPFPELRALDVNSPSVDIREADSECDGGAEEVLEQRGADDMYDYVLESEYVLESGEYGFESEYYDLEDPLEFEGEDREGEEGEEWDCEEEEEDATLAGDWMGTPF